MWYITNKSRTNKRDACANNYLNTDVVTCFNHVNFFVISTILLKAISSILQIAQIVF